MSDEAALEKAHEHMGRQISIKGFSGVGLTGSKRHPKDTKTALCLTLYDQDGQMRELIVPRTRDAEMFQEWLRRYDRYTPGRTKASVDTHPKGGDAKQAPCASMGSAVAKPDAQPTPSNETKQHD